MDDSEHGQYRQALEEAEMEDLDETEKRWDRADFAAAAVQREMKDFISRCDSSGPPKTTEEFQQRNLEFIAILEHCNKRAVEIFERVKAGDQAPHLRKIK